MRSYCIAKGEVLCFSYNFKFIKQPIKDSESSFLTRKSSQMKIALFYKSFIKKVSFVFVILFLLIGLPQNGQANFFTDLTSKVLGSKATANEIDSLEINDAYNSQNLPLLESFINPDLKNIDENEDMVIVQDDSFIYAGGFFDSNVVFEKSSLSDKIIVYTVKEGDTLSEIAELFDVSSNTIRWENNFSGSTIRVGQKLNILPVTGVKHIVKSGDTISKIASKYEAESEDIFIFNGIDSKDILKQGDIIFVPNGIIKTATTKSNISGKSSSSVLSSNTRAPTGYYLRPAQGIVTSKYGPRTGGFHYGVDIGNKRGTPIIAAASGKVVKTLSYCVEGKSSCGGRYGNYVEILHSNGTKTMYAHLSKVSVSVGQSVSQGQQIGTMGSTGRSTGSHLHFEIQNSNGSKMRPPF